MIRLLCLCLTLTLSAAENLSDQQLNNVNRLAYKAAHEEGKLGPLEQAMFKAYLAKAQADFAEKSQLRGSFVPVTVGIVSLFFPNADLSEMIGNGADAASYELSAPIIASLTERLTKEAPTLSLILSKKGPAFGSPQNQPSRLLGA